MPSRERGNIVRDFPEFEHGTHDRPSVHALVQLHLRTVRFSCAFTVDGEAPLRDLRGTP